MSTVAAPVEGTAAPQPARERTPFQAGWALALLTLVFGFNQLDRGIVAILLESIKAEMHLSDTLLGLMTGLGFSFVYFLTAFPLGRLADRTNRIRIISIGLIFYSMMAAVMGFAQNVYQLIACRSLVAVGEASGNAPSNAVIADLYPHAKRSRAIAIWSGGSYLGLFVGLTAGGWIHAHYGWRAALLITASPGVVVGLLLLLTVRDPARGSTEPTSRTHHAKSLAETAKILFSQRSYVMLVIAMMLATFTAYSLQAWVPSFLSRVHHLDKAAVGFYAGFFKGLMGLFGILAGGLLTHQIIKRRPHLIGIVPVVSALLLPFAMMVFLHSRDVSVSLAALALAGFLIPAYTAPGFTMLHSVVPPSARAFATTVLLAVASLVGLGCGPLVVGFLSDLFTPWAGSDSLRYALIFPGLLPFLTAFFFYLSARSLAEDEKRMPTL